MRVEICRIQSVWDAHVERFSYVEATVLQSWMWGEVQESVNTPVLRLVLTDSEGVCAIAQCLAQTLALGRKVILIPRGPLCRVDVSIVAVLQAIQHSPEFLQFVQKQNAIALRIEPQQPFGESVRIKDVEPAQSWMIPLSSYTVESLWDTLKQKTRYNIRLAQKHDVRIERIDDIYSPERMIEIWKTLSTQTVERHGIAQHPLDYYRAVCEVLRSADMLAVYVAFVRNTPVAMNIAVLYGNTMTYMYGASDHTQRAIMAPSLLQWTMIVDALANGYAWYDFYGVAPENAQEHPLLGVTRFKKSFVGVDRTYPGTFEVPLRPIWYAIYQWTRTLRAFLR